MQRQSHASKKLLNYNLVQCLINIRGQEYGLISKASVDKHGDIIMHYIYTIYIEHHTQDRA